MLHVSAAHHACTVHVAGVLHVSTSELLVVVSRVFDAARAHVDTASLALEHILEASLEVFISGVVNQLEHAADEGVLSNLLGATFAVLVSGEGSSSAESRNDCGTQRCAFNLSKLLLDRAEVFDGVDHNQRAQRADGHIDDRNASDDGIAIATCGATNATTCWIPTLGSGAATDWVPTSGLPCNATASGVTLRSARDGTALARVLASTCSGPSHSTGWVSDERRSTLPAAGNSTNSHVKLLVFESQKCGNISTNSQTLESKVFECQRENEISANISDREILNHVIDLQYHLWYKVEKLTYYPGDTVSGKRARQKRKNPAWTAFRQVALEVDGLPLWSSESLGFDVIVQNSRYMVYIRYLQGDHTGMTHLSLKRLDRGVVHDWRDLQRIKNEVCGPEREAVEIYPAESRLVDLANQYHLWVMPEGEKMPIGFDMGRVVGNVPKGDPAKQRIIDPDGVTKSEEDMQEAMKYHQEQLRREVMNQFGGDK